MKYRRWFPVSLALNAVLAIALVAVFVTFKNAPNRPANSFTAPVVKWTAPVPLKKIAPTVSTNALTPEGQMQRWIEQLRAAGAPDKLLAELVVADSEDRWEQHNRDLQKQFQKGDLDEDSMTDAAEQHDREQENELRTLLGDEAFKKFDREKVLADVDLPRLNLAESEIDTLYQLAKDKETAERDLNHRERSGEIDESDLETKQNDAETNYDERVRALLGDRYALLHPSNETTVAGDVKRTLAKLHLNITDDQLAAMTSAQQQWSQQSEKLDPDAKDYDQQIKATDAARDAAMEKVLGADGLDQFKKAQDGNYQMLRKYSSVWQLDDKDVDYVYQMVHSYQASVQDYEKKAHQLETEGQAVDWDGVQANIQQFAQQSQAALQNYLGTDRFNRIKRNEFFDNMMPNE